MYNKTCASRNIKCRFCHTDVSTSRIYATNPPTFALPPPDVSTAEPLAKSNRPAQKEKEGRRRRNVFHDDCRFLDQSDEFDYLLCNVDGGRVLRKHQHPSPPLDEINPAFHSFFDKRLHREKLNKELDLSHLPKHVQKLAGRHRSLT